MWASARPHRKPGFNVKTATGFYGFTHTDGAITVGSYVGGGSSGAFGGWLGTQSNHKLFFFTGNGQPTMTVDTTGNVAWHIYASFKIKRSAV